MRESLDMEVDSVLKFQTNKHNIWEHTILPIKLVKAGPSEIPTAGDTRSKSAQFIRQLHRSQLESLDFAIFSK